MHETVKLCQELDYIFLLNILINYASLFCLVLLLLLLLLLLFIQTAMGIYPVAVVQ
jgi:hypothetical protein